MKTLFKCMITSLFGMICIFLFQNHLSAQQPVPLTTLINRSALPEQLGSISGKVTNQEGSPLSGINISLYSSSSYWVESTPFVATSDENGNYKISFLPTGLYRLQFSDPDDLYALQFYTSATTYYGAAEIAVLANPVENVNITLQPGSRFQGTVLYGDEIFKARGGVTVYAKEDVYWSYATTTGIDSRTGTFDSGALLAGSYRLCADGYVPGTHYTLSSCGWDPNGNGIPSFALDNSDIQEITIDLDQGQFDGEISGVVTGNGAAVGGLEVRLYDADNYQPGFATPRLVVTTTKESKFAFTDLGYARFFLEASDPKGIYATLPYTNLMGNTLTVFGGAQVISDVHINLPLAGTIQGIVQNSHGEPFANVRVFAALAFPNSGVVGGKEWHMTTQQFTTDNLGKYIVKGLVAGEYRLYFVHCHSTPYCLPGSYYGTQPGLETSIDVIVESGEVRSGVNVRLGSGIYLPLVLR